jgi:hypothetical protein
MPDARRWLHGRVGAGSLTRRCRTGRSALSVGWDAHRATGGVRLGLPGPPLIYPSAPPIPVPVLRLCSNLCSNLGVADAAQRRSMPIIHEGLNRPGFVVLRTVGIKRLRWLRQKLMLGGLGVHELCRRSRMSGSRSIGSTPGQPSQPYTGRFPSAGESACARGA